MMLLSNMVLPGINEVRAAVSDMIFDASWLLLVLIIFLLLRFLRCFRCFRSHLAVEFCLCECFAVNQQRRG